MKGIKLWFSFLKSRSRFVFVVLFLFTIVFSAINVVGDEMFVDKQTQSKRFDIPSQTQQTDTVEAQFLADLNSTIDDDNLIKNKTLTGSVEGDRGYLITVSYKKEFERTITKDPDQVAQIFEKHLGTNLDIMKILNQSPYFDMKTNGIYFYAEVGNVHQGKNGKLKFRKIKKSEKVENP